MHTSQLEPGIWIGCFGELCERVGLMIWARVLHFIITSPAMLFRLDSCGIVQCCCFCGLLRLHTVNGIAPIIFNSICYYVAFELITEKIAIKYTTAAKATSWRNNFWHSLLYANSSHRSFHRLHTKHTHTNVLFMETAMGTPLHLKHSTLKWPKKSGESCSKV